MGDIEKNASAGDALKDLFLVTSGICRVYGVFSYQEKLQQTIQTLLSIHDHCPTADIVLIESSNSRFPLQDKTTLARHAEVHEILDPLRYINDYVSKDTNQFRAKTSGELLAFEKFFSVIGNRYQNYRRIFKLSGRYHLTDEFDLIDYTEHKVIIKQRDHWPTFNQNNQLQPIYQLKLWSWPSVITPLIKISLDHKIQEMIDNYDQGRPIQVMERIIFDMLHNNQFPVREYSRIGVRGWFGQDARPVTE